MSHSQLNSTLTALGSCVVIPAYNAAKGIGELVHQIRQLGLETVVVNDGSTDQTAQVAAEAGALVISHLHNRGKGLALRTGFTFALQAGYEAVVTLDSDGQHDPKEIPQLLDAGKQPNVAIVVGNRLVDGCRMPMTRRWTNRLMSWLVSLLAHQEIPDSQCGFRMIRREVLTTIQLTTCRFEIETELLLAAARQGWVVSSVPIRAIYQNHASHIHPVSDGLRFVRLLLHYFCRRA